MSEDFAALLADVSAPETTSGGTADLNPSNTNAHSGDVENTELTDNENEENTSPDDKADSEGDGKPDKGDESDKDDKATSTPAKVRAALKALRDSSPENAKIARELNDVYGRYQSYSKVFPKVGDALEAKNTLEAVGGSDGIAKIQEVVAQVNATDQALYSGSKDVISQLYDDCVANKHPEAFGKLAPHFLDTLAKNDAKAFEATMNPRHLAFLDNVNFPGIVTALGKALESKDTDKAFQIVKEMARFYTDFSNKNVKSVDNENPEKAEWEKERDEFRSNETKQFQTSVATDADKENNSAIFNALKPYVKDNPYFKTWTKRMMTNLGVDVKRELVSSLKKDSGYQAQMKALWSVAKVNKDDVLKYHKSVVALKTPKVTKEVLDRDYSGYTRRTKGTIIPNRGAAGSKTNNSNSTPQSAPVQIGSEPKREEIDWGKDPHGILYTTNKAYLLKTGKLVSWKK